MGKIKIIFFDIDGTLLRLRAKELSEKTVEALNRLKANGIRLCIATGRTPVSLPHFSGIEFDAFLTFNGSLCYNDTETIFSNPISPDDVQKLIRNADSLGRPVSVATKNRLAANLKYLLDSLRQIGYTTTCKEKNFTGGVFYGNSV